MVIDKKIADYIISELSPVVNFDINLIGNDGTIISSTNPDREGTLHYGAIELARHNRDELIIYEDDEYKGCKQGINLPVIVENKRVAIIGITGNPSQVIGQGTIVRKLTEMLVKNDLDRIIRFRKENADLMLVNDLIHGNITLHSKEIEDRITQSGLKCSGPFTVATLRFHESSAPLDLENEVVFLDGIKERLSRLFGSRHMLCVYNGGEFIVLANMESRKLFDILVKVKAYIEETSCHSLICAIGNERDDYLAISRSYGEAMFAETYLPNEVPGVYLFNAAALSVLINQIPANSKEYLHSSIFKRCSGEEINEICDFVLLYFNYNGSITKISEHTFQHKNTVQYRISKIKRKTGLDIRISHDLFVLYIAALYQKTS